MILRVAQYGRRHCSPRSAEEARDLQTTMAMAKGCLGLSPSRASTINHHCPLFLKQLAIILPCAAPRRRQWEGGNLGEVQKRVRKGTAHKFTSDRQTTEGWDGDGGAGAWQRQCGSGTRAARDVT